MNEYSLQINENVDNNETSTTPLNKTKTLYQTSIDESGKAKLFMMIGFAIIVIAFIIFYLFYLIIIHEANKYLDEQMQQLPNQLNNNSNIPTYTLPIYDNVEKK